jgi:hypothetical protein
MTFPVLSAGTSAYNLQRSLRFRSSASAYLNRTPASASNRRTWTWSAWVKRGTFANNYSALFSAGADVNNFNELRFTDLNSGVFDFTFVTGGADTARITTTPVYRDPSAWYHVVVALDTTQATAANRVKIYVNGVQVTSLTTATYPTQNSTWYVNAANAHGLGATVAVGRYFDGYLTEVNFIDGQALTPSSFGSTNAVTGVWQPARYTGTYGTNGFYLPFTNTTSTTTLGNDFSGNSNNWTTNNISLTSGVTYDSMTDVPTLTSPNAANFAVMNPLDNGGLTITGANLDSSRATASWLSDRCTFGLSSSKWYWEFTATSVVDVSNGHMLALMKSTANLGSYPGGDANGWGYFSSNGQKYTNGAAGVAYGSSWTNGDVIGVAFDADNGTLVFYKNNVSQGTAYTGLTNGPYFPALGLFGTATGSFNFGQRPFAYTPPSGFVALNTFNLPSSTIQNGAGFMAATLYTGTGSAQSISNAVGSASFQPDLVWQKARAEVASNRLVDSVRGTSKVLYSNNTNAEATTSGVVDSFNSGGFTGGGSDVVTSGYTAVAWQWKANGAGVTNTSGSITSTVSANTTSGFSVVTYTGTGAAATVGHGLNVAPAMVIAKSRSNAGGDSGIWVVYHKNLSAPSYFLYLNQTNAETFATTVWNNTAPTSTVFSIGSASGSGTASTHVAYCFTPIAGFSAFGSYTGNGSTDGPFVYTGFRPRWLMIKRTDTTSDWYVFDSARNTFNSATQILYPNLSNAEVGYTPPAGFDLLSNGFKSRETAINASGGTYVYAAFAENPFRNSLAR